jgi:gliding motility-associated-like protein
MTDTITLKAPAGMALYEWSSTTDFIQVNDSSIRFSVKEDAQVKLNIERSPGCVASDEIAVTVLQLPAIDLGEDIKECDGRSVSLRSAIVPFGITWNTGANDPEISVTRSGTYFATVKNAAGCAAADTVKVTFMALPVFTLGKDTALCEGSVYNLVPRGNAADYLWQDGSHAASFPLDKPGEYWAQVTDQNNCIFRDTLVITNINKNPSGFLEDAMDICIGRNYTITVSQKYQQYLWSDGSKQSQLIIKDTGTITLRVTDAAGCRGDDAIHITGEQCLRGVFIPNSFTPDNDGNNDVFRPVVYDDITDYHLTIFSRWGQKVFQSFSPAEGWNGLVNGLPQPSGGFVYIMTFTTTQNNKKEYRKGQLLLVR